MEEPQPKLKEAMKTWNAAVAAHTSCRYSDAVGFYDEIPNKSARMYYNMSCAYEKLNDIDNALKCLTNAVEKDPLLAIAYFQRGSLFLLQKRNKEATTDLEKARILMRGNNHINYKPLGLLCRMHSYQVLHNSALACIYDNKTTEARKLLTEASYDADDAQKQIVNKTLEHLNTGDVDLIKPVLVPTDRVFSPPKSITKNLVKKSLIQRARVVSATDTEDLSPTFNGMKRVEEIKQLQAKNDTRNPLAAMRRFVKKPRDRIFSDVTGVNLSRPMRSTKSMGDIQNFEQFSESRVNVNSGDKNFLNLRITNSTSENNLKQIPLSMTPVAGPKTPKSPRSPLRGIKKLLKSKAGTRTSAPVFENVEPDLIMRGCGSTGDLRQLELLDEDPIMTTFAEMKSISSDTQRINDSNTPTNDRQSLGDIFGKSSTVIGQTLSLSCDVLTAIATPSENGCDVTDTGSSESSSDSDCPSSAKENRERDRPRFFIERDCDSNTSIVRRINYTTPDKDKISREISTTLITTASSDDVTSSVIARDNLESRDTTADVVQKRKSRPPPPAYPPPPLPQTSVEEV